jgi:hypothetical protein
MYLPAQMHALVAFDGLASPSMWVARHGAPSKAPILLALSGKRGRVQMSLRRLFLCCFIFFLTPATGYASFGALINCLGNGQLFAYPSTPSPLRQVLSTFFLALHPYDTNSNLIVPVTLNWTSTEGTSKLIVIQNPEAISINMQVGTAVTYSCSAKGIPRFVAGRQGVYFAGWSPTSYGLTVEGDANINIDCYHFGSTGPLFKELSGLSTNILVYLVNIGGGAGTNQTIRLS